MDTTSLRLPDHLAAALERLANEQRTSRSALIREAVEEYIASREARFALERSALARRLVDYPGSGREDGGSRSEEYLRRSFGERRLHRPR